MYSNNQTSQSDECLICFSPLLKDISFVHMIKALPVCQKCLKQFQIIDTTIDFYHYPLRILYAYNEFFKTLLFQYKGLYDQALKDAFLCLYIDELKQQYRNYIVVVAPSSLEDNDIRGFAPIETIASSFSSQIFTGLYKKEKYKQSDLSYEERHRVLDRIGIKQGNMLEGKKVLIMDDVVTSGSTLSACLSLVLKQRPSMVELLVLSTKKSIKELWFEQRED
ncbi:MAG: phosphoribosyltransferase [Coprobacillus sp.]